MNNIYKFIIILSILILGCAPNVSEEKQVAKEINSLNLNIFSKNGEKKYSISSPHSIYDSFKINFSFKQL